MSLNLFNQVFKTFRIEPESFEFEGGDINEDPKTPVKKTETDVDSPTKTNRGAQNSSAKKKEEKELTEEEKAEKKEQQAKA